MLFPIKRIIIISQYSIILTTLDKDTVTTKSTENLKLNLKLNDRRSFEVSRNFRKLYVSKQLVKLYMKP